MSTTNDTATTGYPIVKCPKHNVNHYCSAARANDPYYEPHREFINESECRSANQSLGVMCRKLKGHTGDHAAYTFSIVTPTTWPVAS